MDHTLNHAQFCIYETNALVTTANVKVEIEGEIQHRVVAFFFYC